MTVLEALQEIKAEITDIKTFLYADLNEANLEADLLAVSELPLMVVLPLAPVDTFSVTGKTKTSVPITFWLLTKDTTQRSVEHKAAEVETSVVAPMRLLARRFIHRLQQHEILDKETQGITQVNFTPTYSLLDANVHGVEVSFTLPVIENQNLCY